MPHSEVQSRVLTDARAHLSCLSRWDALEALPHAARQPGVHLEPEQGVLQQVDDAHIPQRPSALRSAG